MPGKKCTCVYATSANTASVRSGHEMGGYLKEECAVCKARRLKAEAEEARKQARERARQTVVVPVHPTAEMLRAGGEAIRWYERDVTCRAVYGAMLALAPAAKLVQVGWYSQQHGEQKFIGLYESPEEPDDPAYRWKPAMVLVQEEKSNGQS